MTTPYTGLEPGAFWRTGVADVDPLDIAGMARPRRRLTRTDAVATAGSCFAQHIARRLRGAGFNFLDVEPAPPLLPPESRNAFGYEMYSARYGNVYTSRQLRQLIERVLGRFTPEERVWETEGRFYDPFRPSIEPDGFDSAEEVLRHQDAHLAAVKRLIRKADVFVFTMGLTETWRSTADGAVYPTCPGTQAGRFDPAKYEFVNLGFNEVLSDMRYVIRKLGQLHPGMRFILTVSPVPLTATASGEHVLPATTYSKSVLRAVAGELVQEFDTVDYFPSYEIITAPVFGGRFFERNMRSVRPEGVDFVMKTFFREVCDEQPTPEADPAREARRAAKRAERQAAKAAAAPESDDDTVCDEKVLEFYAPK